MKKVALFVAVILLLVSCRHTGQTHIHSEEVRIEKDIIQDTVFVTQQDSASFAALLECDSMGQVHMMHIKELQGRLNARLNVNIQDNTLLAECECDSLSIYMQLKHRFTTVEKVEKEIQRDKDNGRSFRWKPFLFVLLLTVVVIGWQRIFINKD